MAILGDLDETFVSKTNLGDGGFRSTISSTPPPVALEVQNFGTRRSIFGADSNPAIDRK